MAGRNSAVLDAPCWHDVYALAATSGTAQSGCERRYGKVSRLIVHVYFRAVVAVEAAGRQRTYPVVSHVGEIHRWTAVLARSGRPIAADINAAARHKCLVPSGRGHGRRAPGGVAQRRPVC